MRSYFQIPTFGIVLSFLLLAFSPIFGGQPTTGQSSPVNSAPAAKIPGPSTAKRSDQLGAEAAQIAPSAPVAAPAAVPPVVILRLESPIIVREQPPATVAGEPSVPAVRQESSVTDAPSETSRKVQVVVDRLVNAVVDMDAVTLFGLAAVVAMLVFYWLGDRSPYYLVGFAAACWMGAACAFMRFPWPFGIVAGIWGFVALRKLWRGIKSKNGGVGNGGHLALLWPTRFVYVLAAAFAVVLLIVDSPISAYLSIPISRAVAEAAPLLCVGIAYLGWLAVDRRPITDLIMQSLIATAFILWGVDLLMPAGQWATFVGAVVIAIYVFDLAWLMERNLHKKFRIHAANGTTGSTSADGRSAGVCQFDGMSGYSRDDTDGRMQSEAPLASKSK